MDVVLSADFLGNEEDAELVEWLVNDGDVVTAGQAIAQLETSKTTNEITAPGAGSITLSAEEGDVVSAGETIATIS